MNGDGQIHLPEFNSRRAGQPSAGRPRASRARRAAAQAPQAAAAAGPNNAPLALPALPAAPAAPTQALPGPSHAPAWPQQAFFEPLVPSVPSQASAHLQSLLEAASAHASRLAAPAPPLAFRPPAAAAVAVASGPHPAPGSSLPPRPLVLWERGFWDLVHRPNYIGGVDGGPETPEEMEMQAALFEWARGGGGDWTLALPWKEEE